jgi:hypothetical protein
MADNSTTPSNGLPVASDDIGGFQFQRVKPVHGADGVNDGDTSYLNPFPTVDRPIKADGIYRITLLTATYAGLAASAPLISFRWSHATKLCALLEAELMVYTTAAASTAAITERQLVRARAWTAQDTGGTGITFAAGENKLRTSMADTVMAAGDIRYYNGGLTAGTRTLDANPLASAFGWAPLNHTGTDISGGGGAATSAAWGTVGGHQGWILHSCLRAKMSPLIFAQNEGFIIRVGQAQPGGSTQRTAVNITWAEGPATAPGF